MVPEHFDLLVIGGGKGGKTLAIKQSVAGHRVALVEKGMIGGSCINVACIPTKTMVKSAKVADLARHAEKYGIHVALQAVNQIAVRQRKREVVSAMVARNQSLFDKSGLTLVLGTARFISEKTVEVTLATGGIRTLTADTVIINTGTRSAQPNLPGLESIQSLDSNSIQELDRLPGHLVILGGGYIGCEFAQLFRRLGSRVTLIDRNQQLLPREEPEISEQILHIFQEDSIDVILGASVLKAQGGDTNGVGIHLQTPMGERVVEGTDLLVGLGRSPNTESLNASSAGVQLDGRGFVVVNAHLQTTAPGVWAIGDVTGGPQFTHASLDDYRIVAANLQGGNRVTTNRLMPYTLFIDPELGRVGLTEAAARQQGFTPRIATLPVAAIPRAVTMGETCGPLKAVVDAKTGLILGVSVLAPEGGEVMAVVQMAMQGGLTASALRDTVFSHPTMSECLNDLFGRLE